MHYFQMQGVIYFNINSCLSKKYSFWPLMLCGEYVNNLNRQQKNGNTFFVFYLYKNWKIMIEMIQQFLL